MIKSKIVEIAENFNKLLKIVIQKSKKPQIILNLKTVEKLCSVVMVALQPIPNI